MIHRLTQVRAALTEKGAQGYVSFFPPTNQYLSGFTGTTSAVIVTGGAALFLSDFRYTEQVGHEVRKFETHEVKGDLIVRTGEKLSQLGLESVAIEPAQISVDELNRVKKAYSGTILEAPNLVATIRYVKSDDEIAAVRAASELAEGVMLDLVETLQEGVTERELAAQFEYEFKKRGASGVSFDPIVLFGPRSSLPHGQPSDYALENGDIVLLDFGCRKGGYCSDLTRTFVYGTMPGGWFREIYDLTLRAQLAALDAVRAGNSCREIDAVARDIIAEGNFGDYFGHGLGHGVGIEIHEGPRLNAESEVVLEAGMVVTVEPGIYLPGKGGVRIEDLVVVTGSDCDILTTSSKQLRVLA